MIRKFILVLLVTLYSTALMSQLLPGYHIYALRYLGPRRIAATQMVSGASSTDSLSLCYMFWLIKGDNNRNILVDAGMLDTSLNRGKGYIRPDSALMRMNIRPDQITDIIITHPHNDHIGGINLFPAARMWMQKEDYEYFVGEAWQEDGFSRGFKKNDVHNIVELNLDGRLVLVDGDNKEIIPGIRVYTGSGHTYGNQYIVVKGDSGANDVLLASDAVWFYYNLDHLLPATLCMSPARYVEAMKRMKLLIPNASLIIPGHDNDVFSRFPWVAEGIVKIQ